MKHVATVHADGIDTYRIGRKHNGRVRLRGRSDRWLRTWQAEWDGCKRAPRAWTERGVHRKARRWQRRAESKESAE